MKESTGELSMVVVTLLAIALIAGVVRFVVPLARDYVVNQWGNIEKGVDEANTNNKANYGTTGGTTNGGTTNGGTTNGGY